MAEFAKNILKLRGMIRFSVVTIIPKKEQVEAQGHNQVSGQAYKILSTPVE